MVRISLVNDHTFRTVFSSIVGSSAGAAGSSAGASGAAPPPQAASIKLDTKIKLKSNQIDLRMFLLLLEKFCLGNTFYVWSSLHTIAQIFLRLIG
jgi:hypothetical protein